MHDHKKSKNPNTTVRSTRLHSHLKFTQQTSFSPTVHTLQIKTPVCRISIHTAWQAPLFSLDSFLDTTRTQSLMPQVIWIMSRLGLVGATIVAMLSIIERATVVAFNEASFLSRNHRVATGRGSLTSLFASEARQKRISLLTDWGKSNDIQIGGVSVKSMGDDSGLGLVASEDVASGSVVVAVPSKVALSVESPGGGPDDLGVSDLVTDRRIFRELPWFVKFSLYFHKIDKVSSNKNGIDLRPWLDSLPRKIDTPIHWTDKKNRDEWLQYPHMSEAIDRQEKSWRKMYEQLQACTSTSMTWDEFVLGCEIARSRAFSGGYTGASFNPLVYAFTLFLVTVYIGLNLGTLEQAANGAALVFCASVLRDFVIPKFFRVKKYVICPVIDMCNHQSIGTSANVAYEFFGDSYSLSMTSAASSDTEVYISYGSRSNDQLLQYYGFTESSNPHDVYIMPPLREWDIAALEESCGGPFAPGRLGKLERAGLLGKSIDAPLDIEDDGLESAGNPRGGVVLTRVDGIDPAVIQALRALVSSESEWDAAGEAVGNFAAEVSSSNEQRARLAARTAIELELAKKATSIEEDREILKRAESSKSGLEPEEELAIRFRIEKKQLLKDCIERLR